MGEEVEEVGSASERKPSVYSLRNKSAKISEMVAAMQETQAARSFSEQAVGAGSCLAVAGQPYLGLTTCRKSIDD